MKNDKLTDLIRENGDVLIKRNLALHEAYKQKQLRKRIADIENGTAKLHEHELIEE